MIAKLAHRVVALLVAVAVVLFAAAAASYALSCAASSQHVAVVISPHVTPRSGDGENFPNVSGIELGEGQTVELLRQRGDWLQIKTKTGQRGWLPEQVLETI